MAKPKTFTWTVEITVKEDAVADGFGDGFSENPYIMMERAYPFMRNGHDYYIEVLTAPSKQRIRKAQGYTK